MPVISRFFGIAIAIYWNDHSPAHFHARYGDQEIKVEIESGKIEGSVTARVVTLIQEWRELHRLELMENWKRAKAHRPLVQIEPLE